jgi:hypothetical protein
MSRERTVISTNPSNVNMLTPSMSYIRQIIAYIRQAQEIAVQHGFKNLLQPGLVKEMIISNILVHEVHRTKHEPDAHDPVDPSRKFEYLTCTQGKKNGTFQFDRMFKSPPDKRAKSLERISRNSAIYCAVFDEDSPLDVIIIYKVPVDIMLREAERQLDASRNKISHVSYPINWAQQHGKVVHTKQI